jgi:hypothetical protein
VNLTDERRTTGQVLKEMVAMLDSFIIEEIRRREERLRQEQQRPSVELPHPSQDTEEPPRRRGEEKDEDKPQRGVVVIDI